MTSQIDYDRREASMCQDYRNGFRTPELAERYGLSRERVRQILKPFGLIAENKKRKAQQRLDREISHAARKEAFERRRLDAIEMVQNGVSIAKAARATRLSPTTVQNDVRERNVKSIHSRWRDEAAIRRRVLELIGERKSVRKIKQILEAEKMRVSPHWIYKNFGAELHAARAAPIPANDNNEPSQEREAA